MQTQQLDSMHPTSQINHKLRIKGVMLVLVSIWVAVANAAEIGSPTDTATTLKEKNILQVKATYEAKQAAFADLKEKYSAAAAIKATKELAVVEASVADKDKAKKELAAAAKAADLAFQKYNQAHLEAQAAKTLVDVQTTTGIPQLKAKDLYDRLKATDKDVDDEFNKRFIRDLGLSITTGISYVPAQRVITPNILIRYNLFQGRADTYRKAYLNTGRKDPAAADSAAMRIIGEKQHIGWPGDTEPLYTARFVPALSILGGYGLSGIEIRSRPGEKASPFIIGGSIGLMNATEASSAFHIDVGWMILEKGSFQRDGQFFVGASLDLIHARDLAKYILGWFDSNK